MFKGIVKIELQDGEGGTVSESIEASAPTLYTLEGIVRDIMFVRMNELVDHIFEDPKFEKPKPVKKAPTKKVTKDAKVKTTAG